MTVNQLTTLKQNLPRGYRKILKQRTGFSFAHIDAVLSGRRDNSLIEDSAITLLEEHIVRESEKKEKLNQLIIQTH